MLGVKAIIVQDVYDVADVRGAARAVIADRRQQQVARIEALGRMKAFVDHYRAAFRAWAAGARDMVFPAGTYALRVPACVRCAST